MADKKEKKMTVEKSMDDFKRAYSAKQKLLDRQKEDFLFALGDQWSKSDLEKLKIANVKPITDNRIAPNIYLLTGLERQNRTDFKAFPEGEEDSLKSEVCSALFKHAIKQSDFPYKSSDQFKDGITCGESHLELYLDYTDNLLNGKPCWRKLDGNVVFPEPGFSEYDYNDCKFVYKVCLDIAKEDLINLYEDKKKAIEKAGSGRLDMTALMGGESHQQPRDYPKDGQGGSDALGDLKSKEDQGFDLIERYYKKWVQTFSIGDKETGKIQEAESEETANEFIASYKAKIQADEDAYVQALQQFQMAAAQPQPVGPMGQPAIDEMGQPMESMDPMAPPAAPPMPMQPPPPPPQQDPERFLLIKRLVPEIWCFAHVPGITEPLADGRAWFYPKWKRYGFIPYYARFSTAPLKGDQSHLLVQGIVHGVKGVQEKHNKAEMLMLRHLNTSANSGWDVEEQQLDEKELEALKNLGSAPGVVIQRRKGTPPLARLIPVPLSQGHAQISETSSEAIKAQLGINADLLATQEGGADSGRAIALRQRQGLLMVQELFDNLSRTRIIAGKFLLSQLGEIYDTETAKKVLGDAFLQKNFPPPMMLDESGAMDPMTMGPAQVPMQDPKTGQPMTYDAELAEIVIAEVLSGDLEKYDVAVGEAVSSETQKMANSAEIKEIAAAYPGLIPPDILIEESLLPQATKTKVMSAIQKAQALAQATAGVAPAQKGDKSEDVGLAV